MQMDQCRFTTDQLIVAIVLPTALGILSPVCHSLGAGDLPCLCFVPADTLDVATFPVAVATEMRLQLLGSVNDGPLVSISYMEPSRIED